MNREWLASSVLLLVFIVGCDEYVLPTAPPPVPPTSAPPNTSEVWIGGVVYDSENRCLQEAVVVMTKGNAGTSTKNECSTTTHGYNRGYFFPDLREGDVVTLRATAPGHVPKEFQITVVSDIDGWHRHDIALARE